MSLEEVGTFNFVEELVATVLEQSGRKYTPFEMCSGGFEFSHWTKIVTSITHISEDIGKRYKTHVVFVCDSLETSEDCEFYVNLMGEFAFGTKGFSWNLFRMFLAMILKLAVFAFKDMDVQLPDDLMIFTAKYIERELQDRMEQLGGWKAFEKDCVKKVLKQQQLEIKVKVEQYKINRKKRMLSRTPNMYSCGNITHKPCTSYPKVPEEDFVYEKVILEQNPGFPSAGSAAYSKQSLNYGSSSRQPKSLLLQSAFKEELDLASYAVKLSADVMNEL